MNNTEIAEVLKAYAEKQIEMKRVADELELLKKKLIKAHGDEIHIESDEYQSTKSLCTRKTLLEAQIAKKYNLTFVPEDYRITEYNTYRVTQRKNIAA